MNRYPLWKYLLILVVLAVGIVYALPNIYPPDPAIQISHLDSGEVLEPAVMNRATSALDEADIAYFGVEMGEKMGMIRFNSLDDQLQAQTVIQEALGLEQFVIALNLAPTTPEWLTSIGAGPMKFGLDLAGGVHFLLEVDTPQLLRAEVESIQSQLAQYQRQERLRGVTMSVEDGYRIKISADTEEKRDQFTDFIRQELPQVDFERTFADNQFIVVATLSEQFIREKETQAVEQNLTALRKRVNELGVSEPLVQRQGRNRIIVQLPGIQDSAGAKKIIGKTASLEFRLEAKPDARASEKILYPYKDEMRQRAEGGIYLERKIVILGKHVSGATAAIDPETNGPMIRIQLNKEGGDLMYRNTVNNIGRRLGVLFIEYQTRVNVTTDDEGNEVKTFTQIPKKEVISAATVRDALNMQFQITGLDSMNEASEIALLLRAGALAAPMGFVEERTIGPSLGKENIENGKKSVIFGLTLVLLFMLVYYRVFGIAANIALTVNLILLIAAMSIFGATLTLPGIAGIVLTVGIAVDANVLIFSRIREELRNGVPPQSAINAGFDRAFTTILDANVTTFIVAIILFLIGTGPIQGFAVTLAIGILTSMFTAIMGTRAIINLIYGGRPVKKLSI